ncbi:MAG: phosphate ABC transporter permease PstA, partial [Cetobacterium sp.]
MYILKGKTGNFIEFLIKFTALIAVVPIVLILSYILYKGLPAMTWEFLTEVPKRGMRAGGIFPAIIGTIYLTLGTIAIS